MYFKSAAMILCCIFVHEVTNFCLIPAVEISFSLECHGGALCSGLYYCCLIEIVMGV